MLWSFEGRVTDNVLRDGYAAGAKILASLPLCRGITDFSHVTSFDVSNDLIKQLSRTPPIMPAELVRVLVAPTNYIYGMARMFVILSEGILPNLHVVRTLDEAYQLLGLTSPHFRRLSQDKRKGT